MSAGTAVVVTAALAACAPGRHAAARPAVDRVAARLAVVTGIPLALNPPSVTEATVGVVDKSYSGSALAGSLLVVGFRSPSGTRALLGPGRQSPSPGTTVFRSGRVVVLYARAKASVDLTSAIRDTLRGAPRGR